ncbi:MAG: O-antigen ligase family protein [Actinomycetota bacterium]|nr:O-antigen ligase family protein [Actinomycetota bacterium]
MSTAVAFLDRLPAERPPRTARALWFITIGAIVVGVACLATTTLQGYVLLREKRLPRTGRWLLIPIGLVIWTAVGIVAITSADFKHFVLLLGIQILASGVILAVVDQLRSVDNRTDLAAALTAFVVLLSAAVFLQWIGVNLQGLQNGEVRKRAEAAYGVDAFQNNVGMIKYARSVNAGALSLRRKLDKIAKQTEGLPSYLVFQPKFQAFENHLVVRFQGSALPYAHALSAAGIELAYDNVGLAPANTVPRMRSFPRNALTYAGVCVAVLPFAFFLWWANDRRKWLARIGVASCLFGAGFSLARGAWVAIVIGVIYLFVDGLLTRKQKLWFAAAPLIAALVLTGTFLVKYHVDPLNGRAGGGASVNTRQSLYAQTLGGLRGTYLITGFGTERPRTPNGTTHEGGRYVPRAGTHSTYLSYFFRTGVPGALLIVALYITAFLFARASGRTFTGKERLFATIAATAMIMVAAHDVILSLYVEPVYTLTVSLVIGAAVAGAADARLLPWRTAKTPT